MVSLKAELEHPANLKIIKRTPSGGGYPWVRLGPYEINILPAKDSSDKMFEFFVKKLSYGDNMFAAGESDSLAMATHEGMKDIIVRANEEIELLRAIIDEARKEIE